MPKTKTVSVYGIEETKDAIIALAAIANAIAESKTDDGIIGLRDLPKFALVTPKMVRAIYGGGKIPKEIADMDSEEKDILIQALRDELKLNDNLEDILSRCLEIAHQIRIIVELIRNP